MLNMMDKKMKAVKTAIKDKAKASAKYIGLDNASKSFGEVIKAIGSKK